jgi:hypothetical protein
MFDRLNPVYTLYNIGLFLTYFPYIEEKMET